MTQTDYLSKVGKVLEQSGWPSDNSPASLLGEWQAFVNLCEGGYPQNIYEYFNDIRVRERIEVILSAPKLQVYSECQEYEENVTLVDRQFEKLTLPDISLSDRTYWWEKCVLRYAGRELVADLFERYRIKIDIKE